jgi:excisionase family DNA binding protein
LPKEKKRTHLEDLETHTEAYVTIGELARYWHVSRQQIYKQIEAGTLPAIRLGPRLLRVATAEALKFERHAHMRVADTGHHASAATRRVDKTAVRGQRT